MHIEPMFFDRCGVMDNRSTVERFKEDWLFDSPTQFRDLTLVERYKEDWLFVMPKTGIVIFKNLLFFNGEFVNARGDGMLERILSNMSLFLYDPANSHNFQKISTITELELVKQTTEYTGCRFVMSNRSNIIYAKFNLLKTYKLTFNMDMNNG